MDRNDIREYFKRLKGGQQESYVGPKNQQKKRPLIKEANYKYDNPVNSKEEALASMVASYFADDMRDIYPDISQMEIDAAESDLYGALIDTGEFYGKDAPHPSKGSYDKLMKDIENKLVDGGYSKEFGRRSYDPLTDEDIEVEDIANADRVMGSPDMMLQRDNPDYEY